MLELPPSAQIRVIQRMIDVYDEREVQEAVDEPVVIPFFVDDEGEWGKFNIDRQVCGVTITTLPADGQRWIPVVGALVVIRARKAEYELCMIYTGGDGRTVTFPAAYCGLPKDEGFRVEVGLEKVWPGKIRCTISGIQFDRV